MRLLWCNTACYSVTNGGVFWAGGVVLTIQGVGLSTHFCLVLWLRVIWTTPLPVPIVCIVLQGELHLCFTVVESSPAVDGPNVMIRQHKSRFNFFAICC